MMVMFCDLVGSTGLAAKLDPEDWRNLVNAYLDEATLAATGISATGSLRKRSTALELGVLISRRPTGSIRISPLVTQMSRKATGRSGSGWTAPAVVTQITKRAKETSCLNMMALQPRCSRASQVLVGNSPWRGDAPRRGA